MYFVRIIILLIINTDGFKYITQIKIKTSKYNKNEHIEWLTGGEGERTLSVRHFNLQNYWSIKSRNGTTIHSLQRRHWCFSWFQLLAMPLVSMLLDPAPGHASHSAVHVPGSRSWVGLWCLCFWFYWCLWVTSEACCCFWYILVLSEGCSWYLLIPSQAYSWALLLVFSDIGLLLVSLGSDPALP